MTPREIVRHSEILNGRWHFEGTTIAIAEVRRDYEANSPTTPGVYRYAGLTDEEIEAALAFEMPAVREMGVRLEYGSVVVSCVCGEDTQQTGIWPVIAEVECPCRRRWRVTVEPAPD